MIWLKSILFYVGAACVLIPIITMAFKSQETPEESKSKGHYPKKLFLLIMAFGFILLGIAIKLCF